MSVCNLEIAAKQAANFLLRLRTFSIYWLWRKNIQRGKQNFSIYSVILWRFCCHSISLTENPMYFSIYLFFLSSTTCTFRTPAWFPGPAGRKYFQLFVFKIFSLIHRRHLFIQRHYYFRSEGRGGEARRHFTVTASAWSFSVDLVWQKNVESVLSISKHSEDRNMIFSLKQCHEQQRGKYQLSRIKNGVTIVQRKPSRTFF